MTENVSIYINILLKSIPEIPIDNKSPIIQIKSWVSNRWEAIFQNNDGVVCWRTCAALRLG